MSRLLLSAVLTVSSCLSLSSLSAQESCRSSYPSSDPDCHNPESAKDRPMPGHPTKEDRFHFVECISRTAISEEVRTGVPAAGSSPLRFLSRPTASVAWLFNANNLFGVKAPLDDTGSFKMRKCPPNESHFAAYRSFKDYDGSIHFESSLLSTPPYDAALKAFLKKRFSERFHWMIYYYG